MATLRSHWLGPRVLRWGLPLAIVGWIVTVTGAIVGSAWLVTSSRVLALAAAVLIPSGFLAATIGSVAWSCYRGRPVTEASPSPRPAEDDG
jgi:hypothetical protein